MRSQLARLRVDVDAHSNGSLPGKALWTVDKAVALLTVLSMENTAPENAPTPAREFFDTFFASLTARSHSQGASATRKRPFPVELVREIEVAAPWLSSLQAAFPQWEFSWHDWTVSTPAGTPPWLITVTEETRGECHLLHFAIPAASTWQAWVEKFDSGDLVLASVVLLEFSLHGKWQEASELPRLIERAQLGSLSSDFWQSLTVFAKEGMDPMPATVAACRL